MTIGIRRSYIVDREQCAYFNKEYYFKFGFIEMLKTRLSTSRSRNRSSEQIVIRNWDALHSAHGLFQKCEADAVQKKFRTLIPINA